MTKTTIGAATLTIAAGLACSVSMAQVQSKGNAQAVTVAADAGKPKTLQALPLHVDGIRYIRIGETHGSGGADTTQQDIYDTIDNGTLTWDNVQDPGDLYVVGGLPSAHTLDDVFFNRGPGAGPGAGGPQTLIRFRMTISPLPAIQGTTATADIEFKWWNTYNSLAVAPTPVNSNQGGTTQRLSVTWDVAGGQTAWGNFVYTYDVALTAPITTTTDFGAAEFGVYDDHVTTSYSTNFYVGMQGAYPGMGDSANTIYYDIPATNHVNGQFDSAGAYTIIRPPADGFLNPLANVAFALQASVDSGSCCMPDGVCTLANSASCTRLGGVFGAVGSTCATATCVQPGACVLATGCVLMSSAQCTAASGTFKGASSDCSNNTCRTGTGTIVLYNNGPYKTGATNSLGVAAPTGTQWSEVAGGGGAFNTTTGYQIGRNLPARAADDFVIPAGETWTISAIDTYAYETGNSNSAISPFDDTQFNLNIWTDAPWKLTATKSYDSIASGGTTISAFANAYRVAAGSSALTRVIFTHTHTPPSPVVLPAGHYWLDWQAQHDSVNFPAGNSVTVPVTIRGLRGSLLRNALNGQNLTTGSFGPAVDPSASVAGGAITEAGEGSMLAEFPFEIRGTVSGQGTGCSGSACYANCDGNTTIPFLNVADFTCFLQKFAQGNAYANCDGSTNPPTLNVADFTCFLQKFAQGCSAP
jgi:hypothetical protein